MTTLQEIAGFDLEKLPTPVLASLLSRLSYRDVASLCNANRELRRRCLEQGLLNIKARQEIEQEAPLTESVLSHEDHLKLIRRGFVTTYHFGFHRDRSLRDGVRFGPLESAVNIDDGYRNFTIIGLPPPKGTKVFVVTSDLDVTSPVGVYMSIEEIAEIVNKYIAIGFPAIEDEPVDNDVLFDFASAVLVEREEFVTEIVQDFLKDRIAFDYMIFELTLP